MKNINRFLLVLLSTSVLLNASCKKDKNPDPAPSIGTTGVFVLNEGAFGSGNASISYLNLYNQVMYNNVFENINGFPLGDVAQSVAQYSGNMYIVVNNSQKIEVVSATDFNSIATISGFSGPRYIAMKGTTGYVSDWFDDNIKIVNLLTNSITGAIPAGSGPEQMLISGDYLFVVNVGGWGSDSTVTVINTLTNTLVTTLQAGVNPNSIVKDANGIIWVLCGGSTGPDFTGGTADDIAGSLWKINPANLTSTLFGSMNSADHPSKLTINNDGTIMHYLNGLDGYTGKVMKMPINGNLPATPLISKEFYGLGIEPSSGTIYGGYTPGFSQSGYIFRYTGNGTLIDSMKVGIGPNAFLFQQQ